MGLAMRCCEIYLGDRGIEAEGMEDVEVSAPVAKKPIPPRRYQDTWAGGVKSLVEELSSWTEGERMLKIDEVFPVALCGTRLFEYEGCRDEKAWWSVSAASEHVWITKCFDNMCSKDKVVRKSGTPHGQASSACFGGHVVGDAAQYNMALDVRMSGSPILLARRVLMRRTVRRPGQQTQSERRR